MKKEFELLAPAGSFEILKAKKYDSARYYNGSYIIISDPLTGAINAIVGKSYNNGKFYNEEV